MPSTTRRLPLFIPSGGGLVAETARLIALAFPRTTTADALRLFVVISCVAEGPLGALLCFRAAPSGLWCKALANGLTSCSFYPNN